MPTIPSNRILFLFACMLFAAVRPQAAIGADPAVCAGAAPCVEVVLLERLWQRTKAFSRELSARFLKAHGLAHHVDVHPSRRAKAEMDRGMVDMLMYYEPSDMDDVTYSSKSVMEGVLAATGRKNDDRFGSLSDHLPDMVVASFHGDELLSLLAPSSKSLSVQNADQAMELLDRGRVDVVFEYSALIDGQPWMEGFDSAKHQIVAVSGPRQVHVRFQDNVSGRLLRDAFDNWLASEAESGALAPLYDRHGLSMSFPAWARALDPAHKKGGQ